MRILGELDERQVRLGYVNCVALMAGRQLDTRAALKRRFDDYLFHKVYENTPESAEFLAEVDAAGKRALEAQDRQRNRVRGGSKSVHDPASILRRNYSRGRFQYRSHLWILQSCLPSHLGPLAPDRSEVFLEHAKHLGILAETYALTELGYALKMLLLDSDRHLPEGLARSNPLFVGRRLAIRALYMWALLDNDILTPFLLAEFVKRRQNDPELLATAAGRLLDAYSVGAKVDSAMELRTLRQYRDRVSRGSSHAERSASATSARRPVRSETSRMLASGGSSPAPKGFKIHRHHARPRLEHYVDVGLLGRRDDSHGAETVYVPLPETHRAIFAWAPLIEDPRGVHRFLDTAFFSSIAHTFGIAHTRPCTETEALLYFATAFDLVGREIGFTPVRTVATAACLLALEAGHLAEIKDMFGMVRAAAKSEIGEYLVFSGGSRLDGEFLVRVKPEAAPLLRDKLRSTNTALEERRRD